MTGAREDGRGACSPDGRAIAFFSSHSGSVDIEPEALPEVAGGAHMSFSPDFSRVLEVVGHKSMWVSPLDSSGAPEKVSELEDPDVRINYPVWSPDGRAVLFDRFRPEGGDVWLMEGLEPA